MKAKIALKKAFDSNVKTLTKNSIKAIDLSCTKGSYHTKVYLLADDLEYRPTFKINQKVINNLKELGYRIGSRVKEDGKYYVNTFLPAPKLD